MKDSILSFASVANAVSSPVSTPIPNRALPRFRPAPERAPSFVVTPRDLRLIEDVWRFGLLTTTQIETLRGADPDPALRFPSRLTLTRRLKLLFHHHYLRRLPRPLAQGSEEPVYVLDHGGARALSLIHGEVSARPPSRLPKAVALDHLLEVAQVRVSLSAVSKAEGLELLEWLPGDRVRFRVPVEAPGQRRQMVSIVPDAGLVLRAASLRHYAFLELDRGTEAARVLTAKALAYSTYWSSGGFARDFKVPLGMGFRVIFVSPTQARSKAILKALTSLGELRALFRVGLAEDVGTDRIKDAIWLDGATGLPCHVVGH